MSSSDFDSLSGLVRCAQQVEFLLREKTERKLTPQQFNTLKEMLNSLQAACPNHKGVIKARVKWYVMALENFEQIVVEVAEKNLLPDEKGIGYAVPSGLQGFFGDIDVITSYLKRGYLKEEFPALYQRVKRLFARLVATRYGNEHYSHLVQKLENDLVYGKL